NSILRAALFENVTTLLSVTVHKNALAAYTAQDNGLDIRLEDGTALYAALLIGTDGRKSKVRDIAGIKTKIKDYTQSAITCIVAHSRSHSDTATEFHRPAGPLAFVPMPGNKSAVVWVEPSERADELLRLRKQDFIATLQNESGGLL